MAEQGVMDQASVSVTIDLHLAFGRVNSYKINPNQELIAIGVTNTIGTVFSAHPVTGSFSRSALKSKSGIRTPLSGIFTVVVVSPQPLSGFLQLAYPR